MSSAGYTQPRIFRRSRFWVLSSLLPGERVQHRGAQGVLLFPTYRLGPIRRIPNWPSKDVGTVSPAINETGYLQDLQAWDFQVSKGSKGV